MIAPIFSLDGQALVPQPRVVVVAGRTLLPVRALAQAVGAQVAFDPATRTIVVQRDTQRALLRIGEAAIVRGGRRSAIPVAPVLVDGRAYAPLRAVADALGVGITYDAAARRVALDDGNLVVARAAPAVTPVPAAMPIPAPTPVGPPPTPHPYYSAEAAVDADPNAPAAAPAGFLLLNGQPVGVLRNAYIARAPAPGERSFDVVVHGIAQGWGFVNLVPGPGIQAPLTYQGGDRFVARVLVPAGLNAPTAFAVVHFYAPDGTPVTYRIPTALTLTTATPGPVATMPPGQPRRLQTKPSPRPSAERQAK